MSYGNYKYGMKKLPQNEKMPKNESECPSWYLFGVRKSSSSKLPQDLMTHLRKIYQVVSFNRTTTTTMAQRFSQRKYLITFRHFIHEFLWPKNWNAKIHQPNKRVHLSAHICDYTAPNLRHSFCSCACEYLRLISIT